MQKKIMRDNAHRIIMTYVFVGGLWILFSDALLKSLSTDPVIITRIAVLKGWFFVFFTAVLLYIMIKKNLYEIKRAHLKISFSEEKFAKAFQKSPDLIALTRFSDGVFIDVNEQFLSKFALSRDKVIGKSAADLNMWLEIIQQPVYRKVLKEEKSIIDLEIKGRSKQGKTEVFLVSAEFLLLEETEYLLIVSREITKQKRTEEKIKKLNRLYALISQINQMLVRCREKELLYSEACHTIEEFGRYKYVFISLIDGENVFFKSADDNSRAEGIFAGMLHPENIGESRPDIFAEAMVTGNLVVINNIEEQSDITWKAQAFSAGWSSVISLPLKIEGIKSGAVNIFSSEENLFDEAEIKLLEEVASDISFAVNNIMQEEKHRLAEAALHKSEERFRVLFQSDIIGIIIADIQGNITEANDVFLKLTGYSREELPLCWKEMLPEDYRQL
ncbi:MAG: GAF domain-containing protein, partial [Methanococcaceae archaeon]